MLAERRGRPQGPGGPQGGYGVQTWSFWQDVSQLHQLYPRDWQTMLNNCKVVQSFGANTLLAANGIAEITGYGDAHAVLSLEPEEMVLQISGDEAVIARKPNYLTDPAFDGLADENPYYSDALHYIPIPRPPIRWYERKESFKKMEGKNAASALSKSLTSRSGKNASIHQNGS